MELIFLDTETTGNDVAKDHLCQICYKTKSDTKIGYFKPPVPISVKAMSITHITNKMVEDKEAFAGSAFAKELQDRLSKGVMIAHNARFDKAILEREGITVPRFICTLRVARYLDSKGVIPEYNLQFLRYYLDLDVKGNPHDAEGDVIVLEAVFQRLFAKVQDGLLDDAAAVNKMIEISSTPTIYLNFNFGKHQGKSVAEVAATNPDYLEWLLNQKLADGGQDEDWIYTLRHHLGISGK